MKCPYADFYVLPLPKRNLAAYRKMAQLGKRLWLKHGALEYREYVGEDLVPPCGVAFPKLSKARRGETVITAIVGYRSRAHRDRVMARVLADPDMHAMAPKKMPFDIQRMAYGGFKLLV